MRLYGPLKKPPAPINVGADVGVGCGRDSPLHAAVQRGDLGVVELLLDFGANAFYGNSEGRTPLDLSAPNSSVRFALQRRGVWKTFHPSICLLQTGAEQHPLLSAQVRTLCLSCAASASANVLDGVVCTEPPAFPCLPGCKTSSSTTDAPPFVLAADPEM